MTAAAIIAVTPVTSDQRYWYDLGRASTRRRTDDLSGRQFGRWTALCPAPKTGRQGGLWMCHCECGSSGIVATRELKNGRSQSCGCRQRELAAKAQTKHGRAARATTGRLSEYNIWIGIKLRCSNPKNKSYRHYGGRGISICDQWRDDFAAFLRDIGPRPSGAHSIDRINVNGNYEPSNCRWATAKEQAQNTRRSRRS